MSAPLLEAENLQVSFETSSGRADVVDGVSLSVNPGEVVTVAGETGCGKSVTMRALLGLLAEPPADVRADKLNYQGQDLSGPGDQRHAALEGDISIVFQDPMASLNPVFTVGEQLIETAQFGGSSDVDVLEYLRKRYISDRSAARKRVREALADVRLPDPEEVMKMYPSQLSGGMQQRVLIAQALLNDPDLLVADEIGTALDVTIHDQILDLLRDLIKDRDLSVLMVTHNLGVARQMSDRIYVMYGGTVVEHGPTASLFRDPGHPYTQGLVASVPRLTGESMGDGIDGNVPDYTDPPQGCRFHPRCPYAVEECKTRRPESHGDGETAVQCHLYESGVAGPTPTLAETREKMGRTEIGRESE
jgi:peptide/nickel transport system ATP-binding protein